MPKPPSSRGPRHPGGRPSSHRPGGRGASRGRSLGGDDFRGPKPDAERGAKRADAERENGRKRRKRDEQPAEKRERPSRPAPPAAGRERKSDDHRPAGAHPAARPRRAPEGAAPPRPRRDAPPRVPVARAGIASPDADGAPRKRPQGERAHKPGAPQRIAKLLARAGIASRREIERMIEERRIAIDGVPLETPATILTSLKGVTVDGKPVKAPSAARLFLFHKPSGVLTAARDPAGRPTIYDRLPEGLPRLMPIGRLDFNTEGLLLLTNDGELKRQLELPSTGVERTYRARIFGEISQEQLEELIQGIEIEGIRYGSIDANLERRTGRNGWVEMRLTEGKNREVRRVLEHFGLEVSRLIRVAYGPFALGDLPVGGVIEIHGSDVAAYRKTLG